MIFFFYETPCRLYNVMINEVFVLKYLIKMKSYLKKKSSKRGTQIISNSKEKVFKCSSF